MRIEPTSCPEIGVCRQFVDMEPGLQPLEREFDLPPQPVCGEYRRSRIVLARQRRPDHQVLGRDKGARIERLLLAAGRHAASVVARQKNFLAFGAIRCARVRYEAGQHICQTTSRPVYMFALAQWDRSKLAHDRHCHAAGRDDVAARPVGVAAGRGRSGWRAGSRRLKVSLLHHPVVTGLDGHLTITRRPHCDPLLSSPPHAWSPRLPGGEASGCVRGPSVGGRSTNLLTRLLGLQHTCLHIYMLTLTKWDGSKSCM
jgi:hypothetical protein